MRFSEFARVCAVITILTTVVVGGCWMFERAERVQKATGKIPVAGKWKVTQYGGHGLAIGEWTVDNYYASGSGTVSLTSNGVVTVVITPPWRVERQNEK